MGCYIKLITTISITFQKYYCSSFKFLNRINKLFHTNSTPICDKIWVV